MAPSRRAVLGLGVLPTWLRDPARNPHQLAGFIATALLAAPGLPPLVIDAIPPHDPLAPAHVAGGGRETVVCLGDSLTAGKASASFVDLLRLSNPTRRFLNAGLNGALAQTAVNARLGSVAAADPSMVVILLGTNDLKGVVSPVLEGRPYAVCQGVEAPSIAALAETLDTCVRALVRGTAARVAVVSPPVLGEALSSDAIAAGARAAAAIAQLVAAVDSSRVSYIPLFEASREFVARARPATGPGAGRAYESMDVLRMITASPWRQAWAGSAGMGVADATPQGLVRRMRALEEVRRGNGLALLVVHLGLSGALLAARLVQTFLDTDRYNDRYADAKHQAAAAVTAVLGNEGDMLATILGDTALATEACREGGSQASYTRALALYRVALAVAFGRVALGYLDPRFLDEDTTLESTPLPRGVRADRSSNE